MSLRLDFRDRDSESAFWNQLDEVATLLMLLLELVGDCPVFFDFGFVTINDIDLKAVTKKIKESKQAETPEQDVTECDSCHQPIADDAEQFDCPRYNGPIHIGCHPADCRSVECREALSDPTGD